MSTIPILEVEQLTTTLRTKTAPLRVVNSLSFELHPGKTLAIVGESGSGKSMTALSLMRLLPQDADPSLQGSVHYKGENLLVVSESRMRELRGNRIGMVFQNPSSSLNPVFTIGDQLRESLYCHTSLQEEEIEERVIAALEDVGIENARERLDLYPHQFSGGMLQRVMIAMALLLNPDILIADEPTTALDVTIQAQVLSLLKNLQKKYQMALLIITHDLGVVAEIADEVLVMYATEGVEKGGVYQIFSNPSHPYTQALLNSRPSLKTIKKSFEPIQGQIPSIRNLPTGCRFHPRCPFVMEKCKTGFVPSFTSASHPSHQARCWLKESSFL